MPAPLQWNAQRSWVFDVSLDRPEMYLIRDHVTAFSDLAKDWTSGPGADFFHFVPYLYQFKVALKDFSINLNLNDHNIIDRPLSRDDNGKSPWLSRSLSITLILSLRSCSLPHAVRTSP